MSSSSIQIRLIRSNADKSRDDLICIEPVDEGNLRVFYNETYSEHKYEMTLAYTGLVGYVDTVVRMVRDDCDPYEFIQLNFPGLPPVLYSKARLHNPDVVETIRDAARILSDAWFHHLADEGDDWYVGGCCEDDDDDSSSTSSDSSTTSSDSSDSSPSIGCDRHRGAFHMKLRSDRRCAH
jgi:hypothetical protein